MIKFFKVFTLLSSGDKKIASLLTLMLLIVALIDTLGVASIMPFIAVISKPEIIENNNILAHAYKFFSFENRTNFLFFLTFVVLMILVISSLLRAISLWAILKFTYAQEHILGLKLLESYFSQSYEWFLNRNSTDLGKFILSESEKVIQGCLIPIMMIISHGCVVFFLLLLLILIQPLLSVYLIVALAISYGGIYLFFRKIISQYSFDRVLVNKKRFEVLNEAFSGIKEIKLSGLEALFVNSYRYFSKRYAHLLAQEQIIGQTPKYIFESISFGGMLIITLYLIKSAAGVEDAIPLIALYAFAGYKIMPSVQQIYFAITRLQFSSSILNEILGELSIKKPKRQFKKSLSFYIRKSISLEKVFFKYINSRDYILKNINFKIHAHTSVGIVGKTGSGKTTLIDVILGFLEPTSGFIVVDGKKITLKNLKTWQNSIGYVSQNSFFSDDSISSNIAFGLPKTDINFSKLVSVAKIAHVHDFVLDLPQGYDTAIGERGVKLSGGQKQRIAIARALYREPRFLILDEATSSLDSFTEKLVMDSIRSLNHRITIIIIAHRLNTLRFCDDIYEVRSRSIFRIGTYSNLLQKKVNN
jgi:ABC-type bacteriocin/lantibiotic exporter with double-glycine peptidase domain